MFEHSVKVPRHFKIAANIFKKVSIEGGSVKTLLYDDKLRHYRTNVLYALINETIKHAAEIDKIFESCGLLTKEPRLDPWLAKVLTAELLFGKKELPGNSKPVQTILSYKDRLEKHNTFGQDSSKTKVIRRPRYVRINTNLLTTSDAIREFQDEGYHYMRCTSESYNVYLTQIQQLTEYDFTQDYHLKSMFVFPAGTKLHEHNLYLENKIILQDKATAMAVHLLAPPPGSVVLDMCAAPGMKTTQLAAFMRNEGKIYAVERNEKRYQTLCDFVEKTGSKCVETLNKDCLEIRRGDYDDVEYIILDPSCSGSGMELCVHNYIEDTRLAKLTSLQEKFLKHAMNAFPNAKRIVYSTCSLFPEENERVITNVVKASRAKWKVQDIKELLKGQWNNFGSSMYGSMGTRCMYSKPDSDFTIGFFLAVLDRDPKNAERRQNAESMTLSTENMATIQDNNEELNDDVETYNKKKKKKKHIDGSKEIQNVSASDISEKKNIDSVAENSVNENFKNNFYEMPLHHNEPGNEERKKNDKRNHNESACDKPESENVEKSLEIDKKKEKKHKTLQREEHDSATFRETTDVVQQDSKKKKKKRKDVSEASDIVDESDALIEEPADPPPVPEPTPAADPDNPPSDDEQESSNWRPSRPASPPQRPDDASEGSEAPRPTRTEPASRYANLNFWKARRVTFYRNGDPFHPGVEFRFKPGRDLVSMDSLLDRLSERLELPRGARFIFGMDGDRKYRLDELEDGASYVVSSYKTFKVIVSAVL
ncbi:probable 28S rRNA (cytosine-C(5))-methyltransferase [Hyposmocoma kahamanoa]|uniref:probable 28S rRNA (cytosine-C(5))-methyltransferase n=1 Tax=Hyposmocoma kahamanoa TaxID=1477025 RepID=UPI000E6D80A5|nr:probable 28S rRNA (cytosine-C(5))-methyltransferase [Hyposmocoma kahamanoa]